MLAKNCWVSPVRTVTLAGVTLTTIFCGGGPELPHPQINNTTKVRGNDSQRLDMSHPFFCCIREPKGESIPSGHALRGEHYRRMIQPLSSIKLRVWLLSGQLEVSGQHPSEALELSGRWHSGIVDVNQAPPALFSLIELCFPAVSRERGAVFSEFGSEIPIELGPSRVPENMNGNIVNAQFPFRESFAHQAGVDVLLNLLETVFVAQRVDEGDVRRIQPDLCSESCIRGVNRFRVFLNQATNIRNISRCLV